jgi:hypothetical protein
VALEGVLIWWLDSKITDFDFGVELLRTTLLPDDFNLHHISLMIVVLTLLDNHVTLLAFSRSFFFLFFIFYFLMQNVLWKYGFCSNLVLRNRGLDRLTTIGLPIGFGIVWIFNGIPKICHGQAWVF